MLKNRPIVAITIGYIIGIIMGLYCKISIAFLYLIIFILYISLKKPHSKKFKLISFKRYFRYIKLIVTKNAFIIILISSIISNTVTILKNNQYENFISKIQNKEIHIKAKVISNGILNDYQKIYILKLENKKFYLKVKKNVNLDYGDLINITGIYEKPKIRTNYKGFDYKEYLKTKGIYGTINANRVTFINKNISLFNEIFLKIKNLAQKNFSQDVSNIVLGISLGYTDEISNEIKENFNESNISHILAVSGMHIGYLVLMCSLTFNKITGKRNSYILSILVIFFYTNFIDYSPSVVRAAIVVVLTICSKLLYRKNDIWTSLSLSLLIILIYNPFCVRSVSFLFSYFATFGIIIYSKMIFRNKSIINTIGVTASIAIFILPISATYFNKIPILSIPFSAIIGLLAGPIFILSLIFISLRNFIKLTIIKSILEILVKILLYVSKIGRKIPLNKLYVITPNSIEIFIYYCIVFLTLFLFSIFRPKRNQNISFNRRVRNLISLLKYRYNQNKRKVKSIVIIIIFIFSIFYLSPNNLKIFFINVEQGDSCLIVTPNNKKILIDGGGSENYDVEKNVLIPYLLARRVTHLDYVIISHFDTDHVRTAF